MQRFSSREWVIVSIAALLIVGSVWWPRLQLSMQDSPGRSARNPENGPVAANLHSEPREPTYAAIEFPQDLWEPAGLKLAEVKFAPMRDVIKLTGKIALNEDKLAHIYPLVEGRVDDVKIRFGQEVKQGELLVVVQSKEVGQGMLQLFQDRLSLKFAQARSHWTDDVRKNTLALLEMARAGMPIENIEESLKDRTMGDHRERLTTAYLSKLKAQATMDRLTPLSESGAVPARQLLEAQINLNTSRAALQSLLEQTSQDVLQASRLAEQNVKELETSIAVAETNLKILGFSDQDLAEIDPATQGAKLSHYPVVAPFSGTVISKDVVLMERVSPEHQILAIADLSTVWVTVDVYESHLPLLGRMRDQTLTLRCDAWPDEVFQATIFYTGDLVQEATRTVAMRAVAANRKGLLKPGLFVDVILPGIDSSDVLQVPETAVQQHEGQDFVFVQSGDESFVRRNVTVGRRHEGFIEVKAGVDSDEKIVTNGGFALKSRMLAELLEE